jgi:hypothetical protein
VSRKVQIRVIEFAFGFGRQVFLARQGHFLYQGELGRDLRALKEWKESKKRSYLGFRVPTMSAPSREISNVHGKGYLAFAFETFRASLDHLVVHKQRYSFNVLEQKRCFTVGHGTSDTRRISGNHCSIGGIFKSQHCPFSSPKQQLTTTTTTVLGSVVVAGNLPMIERGENTMRV